MSPPRRFVASVENATRRPSSEIDGKVLCPSPCVPFVATLTRTTVFVRLSRTNTSETPLVSPGTRLLANEANATHRPSADTDGAVLDELACTPVEDWLARLM